MKRLMIDTNAYTALILGDERILNLITETEVLYMSVIVLGELFAGFKGGSKETENRNLLDRFLNKSIVEILDVTLETAEIFGMIKSNLKKAGNPIPINDVWIASQAFESSSVLLTLDKHFNYISGLRLQII
jgi:tRNA(fMet)-specific endonuclease VapC